MITILCSGSRGDFQPYIALGQQLKKLGRQVRLTAGKSHEKLIRSFGIDCFMLSEDLNSAGVDPKLLDRAAKADSPLKMLGAFGEMKKYGARMTQEMFAACEGSELIVYHPGCAVGYFAAREMNIPSLLAAPFPLHKTSERLSVIMYGKSKSNVFTVPLSYGMLQGMLWMLSKGSVKRFWNEKFGRSPAGYKNPLKDRGEPAIISCSDFVFPRPDDWPENVFQKGYWFVEEPAEFLPPPELASFLEQGKPPVYIGFGSMTALADRLELLDLAAATLSKAGKRGVLCGFGESGRISDTVIAVEDIPHSWLFPKMELVCHHGGAGTAAAGFRAGVPSVIIPFSNDQFAWAHRAYDLGVGAKPIYKKDLTADNFASAILEASSPKIAEAAKSLGKNIRNENGAAACAKQLLKYLR